LLIKPKPNFGIGLSADVSSMLRLSKTSHQPYGSDVQHANATNKAHQLLLLLDQALVATPQHLAVSIVIQLWSPL